jgi:hypothetical protein
MSPPRAAGGGSALPAAPLGAAPWVGPADAGPACPLCLRALKAQTLAGHLEQAGHSSHDAACERCHKHFSTFEALTEHLYGACWAAAACAAQKAAAKAARVWGRCFEAGARGDTGRAPLTRLSPPPRCPLRRCCRPR